MILQQLQFGLAYIDDILVASESPEELKEYLRKLEALAKLEYSDQNW